MVNASSERRIRVLAGSLYYCGQLNHGYTTEQVFEALPLVDQAFFESLARGALEAAAHWQTREDRVTPPPPVRLVPVTRPWRGGR